MTARRSVALIWLLPLMLSGCVYPVLHTYSWGGPREFSASFDASSIPAPIRSTVERDFPGYRIIDGSADYDDALMTLRSSATTFTLDVDYRNPKAYGEGTGPYYYVASDPGEIDMRDTSDPKVSSLIAFFASRYPLGDYVFQGTTQDDPESDGHVYSIMVYRMHMSGTPAPTGADAPREQTWRYVPAKKTWFAK